MWPEIWHIFSEEKASSFTLLARICFLPRVCNISTRKSILTQLPFACFKCEKAFNQSGNLKVHERTHTAPIRNRNISLQAMWKDIWMILNLWNLEAAGIWSDSIPIPHQISIPQYFKTSEPQYQYQYQYQQNWKPQYQYQYQYHSKPQYLNTWYWYCLCLHHTTVGFIVNELLVTLSY